MVGEWILKMAKPHFWRLFCSLTKVFAEIAVHAKWIPKRLNWMTSLFVFKKYHSFWQVCCSSRKDDSSFCQYVQFTFNIIRLLTEGGTLVLVMHKNAPISFLLTRCRSKNLPSLSVIATRRKVGWTTFATSFYDQYVALVF